MDLQRYGLHERLFKRWSIWGDAFYLFFTASLAILVSASAAALSRQPFLFPSLGPTVFLFFEKPLAGGSSPRSAVVGHLIALVVSYLTL